MSSLPVRLGFLALYSVLPTLFGQFTTFTHIPTTRPRSTTHLPDSAFLPPNTTGPATCTHLPCLPAFCTDYTTTTLQRLPATPPHNYLTPVYARNHTFVPVGTRQFRRCHTTCSSVPPPTPIHSIRFVDRTSQFTPSPSHSPFQFVVYTHRWVAFAGLNPLRGGLTPLVDFATGPHHIFAHIVHCHAYAHCWWDLDAGIRIPLVVVDHTPHTHHHPHPKTLPHSVPSCAGGHWIHTPRPTTLHTHGPTWTLNIPFRLGCVHVWFELLPHHTAHTPPATCCTCCGGTF